MSKLEIVMAVEENIKDRYRAYLAEANNPDMSVSPEFRITKSKVCDICLNAVSVSLDALKIAGVLNADEREEVLPEMWENIRNWVYDD